MCPRDLLRITTNPQCYGPFHKQIMNFTNPKLSQAEPNQNDLACATDYCRITFLFSNTQIDSFVNDGWSTTTQRCWMKTNSTWKESKIIILSVVDESAQLKQMQNNSAANSAHSLCASRSSQTKPFLLLSTHHNCRLNQCGFFFRCAKCFCSLRPFTHTQSKQRRWEQSVCLTLHSIVWKALLFVMCSQFKDWKMGGRCVWESVF